MIDSESSVKARLRCPVADMACPKGDEEALLCIERCEAENYNPLTSYRDSAVLFCGVQRIEEKKKY